MLTIVNRLVIVLAAVLALACSLPAAAQEATLYANCFNTSTGDVPYLCSLGADGSEGPTVVLDGLGNYPPVLPDGSKVLRWDWLADPVGLYLVDLDGENPYLVAPQDSIGIVQGYDGSYDGSIIAVIGSNRLQVIDTLSGAITTVAEGYVGTTGGFPRVSSDGTRVLYAGSDGGSGSYSAIWMATVDGSEPPVQLTSPTGAGGIYGSDQHADWSHDDAFIVYSRHVSLTSNTYQRQIRRLAPDGSSDTVLWEQTWSGGASPLNIFGIQVAPDGEQAAVFTRQNFYSSEPWYRAYTVHTIPTVGGGLTASYQFNYPLDSGYVVDHLAQWAGLPDNSDDLVVNTTGDEPDFDLEDGVCDVDAATPGNQGTLRAAIENANHRPGADEITFDIDGDGPHTIAVDSALPMITDTVVLDATTQPGFSGAPVVRLDGVGAGAGASGLRLSTDDSVVKGLAIVRFPEHGVLVDGGQGNVLTDLIVGTDAQQTAGLGNGGDGIRVEGQARITIGDPSNPRLGSGPPSVTSAGNGGNGIYVRNERGAEAVRAMLDGPPSREREARRGEPDVTLADMGLAMAVSFAGFETVGMPNGQSGLCIVGASGVYVAGVRFGPDPVHGLEALLSAGLTVERCTFGTLERVVVSADQIAGNGDSAISLRQCADVIIGSEDSSDDPLIGVASERWFIELEESERVQVAGLLTTALLLNGGDMPPGLLDEMRNEYGGIRVKDSAFTTIGAVGQETVVVNNGGPGIEVSGPGSEGLVIQATHVGTTSKALTGLGNDGAGICVRDSVPDFTIGSMLDDFKASVVSAGNQGPGLEIVGILFGVEQARLVAKVWLGLVPDPDGSFTEIANGLTGLTIENCYEILVDDPTMSASDLEALRIRMSEGVTVRGGSIGRKADTIDAPDDIVGPAGSGIRIEDSVDVVIGIIEGEEFGMEILGAGAFGIEASGSRDLRFEGVQVGTLPGLDSLTPELRDAFGSDLGGVRVERCEEVEFLASAFANNGSSIMDANGGRQVLVAESMVHILDSSAGSSGPSESELASEVEMRVVGASRLLLTRSDVSADIGGIAADNSQVILEASSLLFADPGQAPGELVTLDGGVLEMRQTVLDGGGSRAGGDLVVLRGGAQGVLRFNDFLAGGGHGVRVEGSPPAPVVARENWWGAADGPAGEGPGAGSPVSSNVDFADWLTGPLGVVARPDSAAYTVEPGSSLTVGLAVANLLVGDDTVDVTVHDPWGWLVGAEAFSVEVTGGGFTARPLQFEVPGGNSFSYEVLISAVSRTDPALSDETRVRLVPAGGWVALEGPAMAGDTVLDVPGIGFALGDTLVVDPGGAGEEEVVLVGYGSLVLSAPLLYPHAPGALIMHARSTDLSTSIDDPDAGTAHLPELFVLHEPYPNPFNPHTTLAFDLPGATVVSLTIYDLAGRKVRQLVRGEALAAGRHERVWRGTDDAGRPVSAGVYLGFMETDQRVAIQRMALVK